MGEEYKTRRLIHSEEQSVVHQVLDFYENRTPCKNGHLWIFPKDAERCCNGWVECKMSCMERFARERPFDRISPIPDNPILRFLEPEKLSAQDRAHYDSVFGTVLISIEDVAMIERLWGLLPEWLRRDELEKTDGLGWLGYYRFLNCDG